MRTRKQPICSPHNGWYNGAEWLYDPRTWEKEVVKNFDVQEGIVQLVETRCDKCRIEMGVAATATL